MSAVSSSSVDSSLKLKGDTAADLSPADRQRVRRGQHEYLLPQSSLPGAARAPKPKGNGRAQNTKAAQEKRLADAAKKREALAAKQVKPRKKRSDKGVKRGPRAKK